VRYAVYRVMHCECHAHQPDQVNSQKVNTAKMYHTGVVIPTSIHKATEEAIINIKTDESNSNCSIISRNMQKG
jgi:hypothetical protein